MAEFYWAHHVSQQVNEVVNKVKAEHEKQLEWYHNALTDAEQKIEELEIELMLCQNDINHAPQPRLTFKKRSNFK